MGEGYGIAARMAGVVSRPGVVAGLITLVGLVARFYRLDARGFWFDELSFAHNVQLQNVGEIFYVLSQFNDQSPLSFFLVWLVKGFGGSEWVVRLPFAIAGTLTVPAVYFLGRELARPRVGLVAALLFALSPFDVFYSQDAHPYAPLMLFTTLQVLFAYRSAVHGKWYDWVGLSAASILNLYNDHLALIVSAVVALFLVVVMARKLVVLLQRNADGHVARGRVLGQLGWALMALVVITLAYLPWVPSTQEFLRTQYSGFRFVPAGQQATLSDVQTLAHGFGFNKLFDALLLVGAAYVVVTFVRERRLSSLLLLLWVALPLAAFWLRAGEGMLLLRVRYYSFLLPAAIVLIALGVEWAVSGIVNLYSRLNEKRANQGRTVWVVYAIALAVILPQGTVALAESYAAPKTAPQDYRGAVDRIIAESTPDSLVLWLGTWGLKPAPNFMIDGIDYYLWLRRSPIDYRYGSLLDKATATHTRSKDASVWGVVIVPVPPEEVERARRMGLEVIPLENLTLFREAAPRDDVAEQIDRLLAWGNGMEPGLVSVRSMLNPQVKAEALGGNLLPAMSDVQKPVRGRELLNGEQEIDKWVLWSGTSASPNEQAVVLSSDDLSQQMVNVTLSTRKLEAGKDYVLSFGYSNRQLSGEQRVYVSVHKDDGSWIDVFPYGEGFLCPSNSDSESAFAFHVPTGATNAIVWLRIRGLGSAEFSDVEMRAIK